MIEQILIQTAQTQGIIAVLLVFLIVRIEAILKKCLSNQHDITSQMLIMIGDIICDKNDTEMCRRFDEFKVFVESKLASKKL